MPSSAPIRRAAEMVRSVRKGGLVRVSARVTADGMLRGAAAGRFPYQQGSRLVPWYSPIERAVVRAETVHLGETLRRRLRRKGWVTSVNQVFDEVVRRCADRTVVWISPGLQDIYVELHRRGRAYSLEVWSPDGHLIGGTFGLQAGGMFSAESLFHTEDHASKVALVDLASRVRAAGGVGVDCQFPTRHTSALGAELFDRKAYRQLLRAGLDAAPRLATETLPAARLIDPLSSDALDLTSRGDATPAHR